MMNGWASGRMNEWADRRMDGWKDGWVGGPMTRRIGCRMKRYNDLVKQYSTK